MVCMIFKMPFSAQLPIRRWDPRRWVTNIAATLDRHGPNKAIDELFMLNPIRFVS